MFDIQTNLAMAHWNESEDDVFRYLFTYEPRDDQFWGACKEALKYFFQDNREYEPTTLKERARTLRKDGLDPLFPPSKIKLPSECRPEVIEHMASHPNQNANALLADINQNFQDPTLDDLNLASLIWIRDHINDSSETWPPATKWCCHMLYTLKAPAGMGKCRLSNQQIAEEILQTLGLGKDPKINAESVKHCILALITKEKFRTTIQPPGAQAGEQARLWFEGAPRNAVAPSRMLIMIDDHSRLTKNMSDEVKDSVTDKLAKYQAEGWE